jgi:hypothetical protein
VLLTWQALELRQLRRERAEARDGAPAPVPAPVPAPAPREGVSPPLG